MKLLFVCTANVCRSPLAEGYFKSLLQSREASDIEAISAGIAAIDGARAFDCAIAVARDSGFDLSAHKAQRVSPLLAASADLILCMESWQAAKVIDIAPAALDKIVLLGNYHPVGRQLFQIPDPRSFTVEETVKIFCLIRASVDTLLRQIK